ncbi:Glycosyltransferase AglE [uncultured archaeon]|nr:Glycosyltransferase AglE [uncultured archaeon]
MQQSLVSIIVPTLNEEKHITQLLTSIKRQSYSRIEIIIVDGGSKDKTLDIANGFGAMVKIIDKLGEFESRNIGAKLAKGKILIQTCADIVFPEKVVERVVDSFLKNKKLVGLTGPGIPINPPYWGKLEYIIYNKTRLLASKFKIFSTSTNFLACKKNVFEEIAGFRRNDVNADGLFGRELSKRGEIKFDSSTYVHISSRRLWEMGFLRFNLLFLYVLENFIPFLSSSNSFNERKVKAKQRHHKLHENLQV